jgi:HSP20 family protein
MTIIRWNQPGRLSDIFDDIFTKSMEDIDKKDCDCVPAANIIETDEAFEIQIAAPGYNKSDIHVDLENNVLSVYCDKNQSEGREINYTRREFGYGTFRRAFTLPKVVDADKISADYKNGILFVKMPKREEAKSRLSREISVS